MAMDDYRCARCGRLLYQHDHSSRGTGGAAYIFERDEKYRSRRVKVCDGYKPKKKERSR